MLRETGTAVTRAFGPRQSVEAVADAIARTIEHPLPELYPYGRARALVWLNAFAPGICDRVVKRFGRKPVRQRALRLTNRKQEMRRPGEEKTVSQRRNGVPLC
jgi:hypothetical protein